MSTEDLITVYVLNESRSARVVWLLEELGVKYNVKAFERVKFRAPQELKKIHPLGRVPIVEIYKGGDKSQKPITLVESGYIFDYLVENYDVDNKLGGDPQYKEFFKYLHYSCEGSIQHLIVSSLVLSKAVEAAPFGFTFLVGKITSLIKQQYYTPELRGQFKYLDTKLGEQGTQYLCGDKLSAADILLSFPIADNIFSDKEKGKRLTGLDANEFKNLNAWAERILKNENKLKALSIEDKAIQNIKL